MVNIKKTDCDPMQWIQLGHVQ